MENSIYALKIKGADNSIFYIGRTKNIKMRMVFHRYGYPETYVGRFVRYLNELNIEIDFEILTKSNDEGIHIEEVKHIENLSLNGCLLMNLKHNKETGHLNGW